MADGGMTLQIDGALAERLKARASATGQSVEDYARQALAHAAEAPGFSEAEVAYADEIDRICDEAERTGGVPWEQFRARLLSFGDRAR
jgi:plasmid stability protein